MFEVSPIRVAVLLASMAKDALRGAVADAISRALEDEHMRELVMLRSYWRSVEKLRRDYPDVANSVVISPATTPCPEAPADDYEIN